MMGSYRVEFIPKWGACEAHVEEVKSVDFGFALQAAGDRDEHRFTDYRLRAKITDMDTGEWHLYETKLIDGRAHTLTRRVDPETGKGREFLRWLKSARVRAAK